MALAMGEYQWLTPARVMPHLGWALLRRRRLARERAGGA